MIKTDLLSSRSKSLQVDMNYLKTYSVYEALQNPYHQTENPEGIINLGTAVSGLMDDIWLDKLQSKGYYEPHSSQFRYYQFWGPNDFLQNLATFMTKFFKPTESINYENLIVLNGALTSLDVLGFVLGDEKDVFLCPTPAYSSYFQACVQRWGIEVVTIPMKLNEQTQVFELTVDALENEIQIQLEQGKTIRALIFNNPHNPLGMVFHVNLVMDIMRFCQKYALHLIVDEMYCMSVFDELSEFRSVLSIDNSDLLDPNRLHVIWGFSKDLCLTSFRTGVIHTYNENLQLRLKSMSQFQAVPLPMMRILQNIIIDIDWFQNVYIPTNHERMKRAYIISKAKFESAGIKTTTTNAGFFFLVDLRPYLNPPNETTCRALVRKFYENKVYLTPSWDMKAPWGWFRVVFTVYSEKDFETGFQRVAAALKKYEEEEIPDKLKN